MCLCSIKFPGKAASYLKDSCLYMVPTFDDVCEHLLFLSKESLYSLKLFLRTHTIHLVSMSCSIFFSAGFSTIGIMLGLRVICHSDW